MQQIYINKRYSLQKSKFGNLSFEDCLQQINLQICLMLSQIPQSSILTTINIDQKVNQQEQNSIRHQVPSRQYDIACRKCEVSSKQNEGPSRHRQYKVSSIQYEVQSTQYQTPYINPIVKHTLDSLPKIYGSNSKRKKKYNVPFLFKKPIKSIERNSSFQQKQRNRGKSCIQLKKANKQDHRLRQQTIENQLKDMELVKKTVNMETMHLLAKPKAQCNKRYCSCKLFPGQTSRKNNTSLSVKRRNLSDFKLPKLKKQILDDRQSKHKVDLRLTIEQTEGIKTNRHSQSTCCNCCQTYQQNNNTLISNGIMSLMKKKQQKEQQALNKLNFQSESRMSSIDIQIQPLTLQPPQASLNQCCATQTITLHSRPPLLIDQCINTDIQTPIQNHFVHLQKTTSNIATQTSKKQPMEHLSRIKEKYKNTRRKAFVPKYNLDDQSQQDHQNDQTDIKPTRKSYITNRNAHPLQDTQDQFQLEAQNNHNGQLIMTQRSLVKHIANAMHKHHSEHKKTIFSILRKKQLESETEQLRSQSKEAKSRRTRNRFLSKLPKSEIPLIDQSTGLFTIPEQQQYMSYLKSYKPLSKSFNLNDLIKSPKFRILKQDNNIYFGQTCSQKVKTSFKGQSPQKNSQSSKVNKQTTESRQQMKHGSALMISQKQIFQGIYENNIKVSGIERNIDGTYIGEFLNGKRHGKGKFIWNNGQTFQGEWKMGTKNGYGMWKTPKGYYYKGQWLMNRQHGEGTYQHGNSKYHGQFVNFLKHGKGKETFSNGDVYQGQYKEGKPDGKGKYVWKSGAYYQGTFAQGLRQGKGIWHQNQKQYYEGNFHKDFKHGYGKQFYRNGDSYEGQFTEGLKTKGIYKEVLTGKQIQITAQKDSQQKEQKQQQNISILNDEIRLSQQSRA